MLQPQEKSRVGQEAQVQPRSLSLQGLQAGQGMHLDILTPPCMGTTMPTIRVRRDAVLFGQ